jgi:protein O-GlcNAc transferase
MNRQQRRAVAKAGRGVGALAEAVRLYEAGRAGEADRLCRRILASDPDNVVALHVAGLVALQAGRNEAALDMLSRAIQLNGQISDLHVAIAEALHRLGRADNALAHYRQAVALNPRSLEAHYNAGNVLLRLGRYSEAIACYDRALALRPDFALPLNNRGHALFMLGRPEDALASYDRALVLDPDFAEALNNRGNAAAALERHEDAARDFARLLALNPAHPYAQGALLSAKLYCCDWQDYADSVAQIAAGIAAGKRVAVPYLSLSVSGSPALQLRCAQIYGADHHPAPGIALWRGDVYRHDRIRVAYLSADFHSHATAHLMAGLFETHDRTRFETTAISFGPDSRHELRQRVAVAFERFVEARNDSDRQIAQVLKDLEIDIAVDLKGYTQGARPGILAFRPAPLQVDFLGYPGTLGLDYVDYLIADRVVIPEGDRPSYSEKIVALPDTYQPNDSRRRIAEHTPTRREAGLPETGFVFCCFNKHYKIAPPVFAVWMRLLRQIEGSVLWLLEGNDAAAANLRREAEARGVAAARLIFAPRIGSEDHLARHRLADLSLDTLPYNAHTTASDALWAGLPLVTCLGSSFAGRVAASLLEAVGLPELIATNLVDYEALALALARDSEKLAAIREKLARHRATFPLFDTGRFTRHIERVYEMMCERHRRGELPAAFAVPPEP